MVLTYGSKVASIFWQKVFMNKNKRDFRFRLDRKIKRICFDLDGTLLNSEKHISLNTSRCITKLRDRGISFALVSGRHYEEMTKYADMLGFSENDYLISSDGFYLFDYSGKLIYRNQGFELGDITAIIELGNIAECAMIGPSKDFYFRSNFFEFFFKKLQFIKNRRVRIVDRIDRIEYPVEKIVLKSNLSKQKLEKISKKYFIRKESNGTVEIFPVGISKFTAIKKLLTLNNEAINEILYFGDEYNDLECFENIKYTIAMGNAQLKLKKLAWGETLSNDQEGVCYALSKLFGI